MGAMDKGSVYLALIPVFKPHIYKLYILRHCTNNILSLSLHWISKLLVIVDQYIGYIV